MKNTHFDSSSSLPLVKQIANFVVQNIEEGVYKKDDRLLSITAFSKKYGVARDTVEKAYSRLKNDGIVAAVKGKGYFVVGNIEPIIRVLLLFNKLSYYKKVVYDAIVDSLGDKAKVDLFIHHYSPSSLGDILNENLGKYNFYVLMPHFFHDSNPKENLAVIKRIPETQLILLDKQFPSLPNHKGVFQNFKEDIYKALISAKEQLLKYKEITIVFPKYSSHPKEITDGVNQFCKENKLGFSIIPDFEHCVLYKGMVFVVITESHLAELIKMVRQSNFVLGNDIGIISFNDTVFKELLDITVISTDFQKMGHSASKLILSQSNDVIMNPFNMISRNSL